MSLSFLILGPELETEIRRVRAHAEKPQNLYTGEGAPPGDDPAFVVHSGMFKIVYSLTRVPGVPVFRHLSVSTSNPGSLPNEVTVYTVCHLFGFTGARLAADGGTAVGPGDDWAFDFDGPAIAVQQVWLAPAA